MQASLCEALRLTLQCRCPLLGGFAQDLRLWRHWVRRDWWAKEFSAQGHEEIRVTAFICLAMAAQTFAHEFWQRLNEMLISEQVVDILVDDAISVHGRAHPEWVPPF